MFIELFICYKYLYATFGCIQMFLQLFLTG